MDITGPLSLVMQAGDGTRCGKDFNLSRRTWEDYRDTTTRFYGGTSPSGGSKEWETTRSGLTFQEWTQDVDTSRPPVAMIINSSELRAAGFKLKEVLPPQVLPPALEAAARGGLRTRGAGL